MGLENYTGVWLCGSRNSALGLPKRRGVDLHPSIPTPSGEVVMILCARPGARTGSLAR
jgi:hypothetical protein